MKASHHKTLLAIFERPVQGNIKWARIESLLVALGAQTREGRGARVRFYLNDRVFIADRPHKRTTAGVGLVERVRDYLEAAGVKSKE